MKDFVTKLFYKRNKIIVIRDERRTDGQSNPVVVLSCQKNSVFDAFLSSSVLTKLVKVAHNPCPNNCYMSRSGKEYGTTVIIHILKGGKKEKVADS